MSHKYGLLRRIGALHQNSACNLLTYAKLSCSLRLRRNYMSKSHTYATEHRGGLFTETYRIYFCDENHKYLSPFHDIPLSVGGGSVFNMIVEIPRWSNAKMEIAKKEILNPIHQDTKDGQVRFVTNPFPYHGYIWNYGALPQTWENPNAVDTHTGCKGDDDPIDVLEIGAKIHKSGTVVQVKVLGALAVIDEGETDWKLLAIDITDPDAQNIKDVEDIDKIKPGLIAATIDWFRIYKIPHGNPPNEFAFNGVPKNAEFVHGLIKQKHEYWVGLSKQEIANTTNIACERTMDQDSPLYIDDLKALLEVNQRPPFFKPLPYDPYIHNWHFITTHREYRHGDSMIAGLFTRDGKERGQLSGKAVSPLKPPPPTNFKIDEGPEI